MSESSDPVRASPRSERSRSVPTLGGPAPAIFEPELSGAIERAGPGGVVLPMVLDDEAVGAIVVTDVDEVLEFDAHEAGPAPGWSVAPVCGRK